MLIISLIINIAKVNQPKEYIIERFMFNISLPIITNIAEKLKAIPITTQYDEDFLVTQIKQVKELKSKIALEKIVIKMQPLIKKYSRKIFFMEKDDAVQELSLALIEAINHIQVYDNEAMCLTYLHKAVINKYFSLCKTNIIKESQVNIEYMEISDDIPYKENYEDIELLVDMNELLKGKSENQRLIIKYILIDNLSDSIISVKMHVSRQYVNRVKKKIFTNYFK